MGRKLLALLCICMFAAGGCKSLVMHSTQMTPTVNTNKTEASFQSQRLEYGIHYFLPTGKIKLKLSVTNKNNCSIAYEGTIYEPDLNYFFLLKYKPVSTSKDDVLISITNDGLLEKVTVTSTEQSAAIVAKVIEIAKEVAKIAFGLPFPTMLKSIGEEDEEKVIKEVVFVGDLLSEEGENAVKEYLTGTDCAVELKSYYGDKEIKIKATGKDDIFAKENTIYYRPLLPYKLIIRNNGNEAMQTVLLPNEAPILAIDITRTAFIEKFSELTFDKGTLKSIHIIKPSEALAFADIPLSILRGILSLPSDLIKVKVEDSKLNQQLLDAYKTELETKAELEKLRIDLENK